MSSVHIFKPSVHVTEGQTAENTMLDNFLVRTGFRYIQEVFDLFSSFVANGSNRHPAETGQIAFRVVRVLCCPLQRSEPENRVLLLFRNCKLLFGD
jgi:hypothetical protein